MNTHRSSVFQHKYFSLLVPFWFLLHLLVIVLCFLSLFCFFLLPLVLSLAINAIIILCFLSFHRLDILLGFLSLVLSLVMSLVLSLVIIVLCFLLFLVIVYIM